MDSTATATKLETPCDHVRVVHAPARSGCVAVAQRVGDSRTWRERAISLRDVGRYVASLPPGVDSYLSQGRFAGRRKIASLVTIGSVWSDLDVHKDRDLALRSDDELLSLVLHRCDDEGIPAPSYVVSSGQGFHVVWLHEAIPSQALPRWQACQAGSQGRVRGLHPDPSSRDAARMLRLVGTQHVRAERLVRCIYPVVGEPVVFSFEELVSVVAPYRRDRKADRERARRPGLPLSGLRLAAHDGKSLARGPWVVWARRWEDLKALRRIRWWGTLPEGQRDEWVFLMSCALSWMVPAGQVLRREVLETGREALGGAWSDAELERQMGSVLRRAQGAARGETVEWPPGSGQRVDVRYRFKDVTIRERLQVTPEELRQLPVTGQLAPAALAARQAARGRQGGVVSGEVRRQGEGPTVGYMAYLRQQEGLSLRAIADRVGMSHIAVRNVLLKLGIPTS